MRQVPNVNDDLFTIAVAFTDADGNDASYEVSNMEKITFRLVNSSGVTIGMPYSMMDANVEKHTSDYSTYYASHTTTAVDDLPYSAVENHPYSEYVLTDDSFKAKGDSRIANGGNFKIYVETAYDYTQNDTAFPEVTNELDISGEVEFKVEESHTRVTDPNSVISVSPIKNKNAEQPVATLEEDTIVGLNIDTGYSLSDVHQIIYYVYELTSETGEPLVEDDNPDVVLNNSINSNYWMNSTRYKKKTVNITTAADAGASARPWIVYFDDANSANATANLDDGGNKIFERGKVYFVRYVIVTTGILEDAKTENRYPHCAYPSLSDLTVPFYRSNVFGIERQTPTLQRYLWDTTTDGSGKTTQQWKYKLNDPDNAILAYQEFDKSKAEGTLVKYGTFEEAFGKLNGEIQANKTSLTNLYDDSTPPKPKTTYEIVEMAGLDNNKWYTLEIPYCIFEKNTRTEYEAVNAGSILSVPGEVKAVSHIKTDIAGVNNNAADFAVDGVMVKDIGDTKGISDEYGYRIRLVLQGSEVEKVSALKVTLTGKDDSLNEKTVVYDPVPIEVQNGPFGAGANFTAYAYLEYVPIVKAGINHRDVNIKVEAYYTTNRGGMNSFNTYVADSPTDGYTDADNIFANGNAWALKGYEYEENNGVTSYKDEYKRITSELGTLNSCQTFIKDQNNKNLLTKTLAGSIFVPRMSASLPIENIGFSDERNLALKYAVSPLVYTEKTDDSFSDVMYLKELELEMDEVGAKTAEGTNYYVLEELGVQTLKIDFGDSAKDYKEATFLTGDGMPGIAKSESGSSSGMTSATMQFDIKGALPGTDKGYYIYLYDETGGNVQIPLKKLKDADGFIYYLAEGGSQTTPNDTILANDDSVTEYGLKPSDDGKKVTFAIRGLDSNNEYHVMIKAKDTQNNSQYLFDYVKNAGEQTYYFKTKGQIELALSEETYIYNTYTEKRVSFRYAVKGSEGTGMRIFYKVYEKGSTTEVMCGTQTRTDYGYVLEPLGNQVKYYQSDMTLCNPVLLDFSPNGPLKAGKEYVIKYTAYVTSNSGAILDTTPINDTVNDYVEFTVPSNLKTPRASVRVVSGSNLVNVTVVMYDTEKTIHNGKFYIDAYDLAGNRITDDSTRLTVDVTPGTGSTVYTGAIQNLPPNGSYRIVVTAPTDRNNDGVVDYTYTNELTANTISTASATVSTSFNATGHLVLKIQDLVNFDNVDKIVYSIDSQDGATNFENASHTLAQWNKVGNTYNYTTTFAPEDGTYHYTLQFYNGTSLIGSTSGYFTK